MENTQLQSFDKLAADITQFVQPCKAIAVTDEESKNNALLAGRHIKDFQKRIEEKRKELTQPLLAQKKTIDDYAKRISQPLHDAEVHLKRELVKHEQVLEKIRQEEMKKAEEARKKAEAEAMAKLKEEQEAAEMAAMLMEPETAKKIETEAKIKEERVQADLALIHQNNVNAIESQKVSGAGKHWTFKVTDASKVPREFLEVNEKAIREAVRSGVREIPGVEIFQETRVAFR